MVGLGTQGNKRIRAAGQDIVATVDPLVAGATYRTLDEVPLDSFDAALVCTPDQTKLELLSFLLSHGKHALVEKPLVASDPESLHRIQGLARSSGATCYTAYNHRFEPLIVRLKQWLQTRPIGTLYLARLFYGNGTALDVKQSSWRDQDTGVLADLGSHLLDLTLFLFGQEERKFQPWSFNRFENHAFDHVLFGSIGNPVLELEATLLSWRSTFTIDIWGELGSAHLQGLCKWGPTTLTLRKRIYPSGKPEEKVETLSSADPTWALEYQHFKQICESGAANIENDFWINSVLNDVAQATSLGVLP